MRLSRDLYFALDSIDAILCSGRDDLSKMLDDIHSILMRDEVVHAMVVIGDKVEITMDVPPLDLD